jgi:hypothetical protein
LARLKGFEAGLRRNRRWTGAASTLLTSEESLQFSTESRKPALTRMLVTSGHWASAEAPEA